MIKYLGSKRSLVGWIVGTAEAILRAAHAYPEYDMDAYRAGYAIGLAKRGRFREAVRLARRLPYAVYRVHALANIAAELKQRGM